MADRRVMGRELRAHGVIKKHAKESTPFPFRGSRARAMQNWPVSYRLMAVIVVALIMGLVFGGLRVAAAADSAAGFGRVTQLAKLGQQVTGLVQALENERDETAERHGARIRLRPGSFGGLTALVWLPDSLIERAIRPFGGWAQPPAATGAGVPGGRANGRHAIAVSTDTNGQPAGRPFVLNDRAGRAGAVAGPAPPAVRGQRRSRRQLTRGRPAGQRAGPVGYLGRRPACRPDHRRSGPQRPHGRRAARACPAGEPHSRVRGWRSPRGQRRARPSG
jgi:hypothetical protein